MDSHARLEVTDGTGWHTEFPLEKSLVHIGSDPRNDIVLPVGRGSGVAPRHAQLVSVQDDRTAYRLINLGSTDILLDALSSPSPASHPLAPRSTADMADGTRFRLGGFTIVYRLGAAAIARRSGAAPVPAGDAQRIRQGGAASEGTSEDIGLELYLPRTVLDLERPIEGTITVRNLGNKPGVQFRLELQGLEADSYDMGLGPILFPNAENEVLLRLHHSRKPFPPAGEHQIQIRALAPEAYPGQCATVSQIIRIPPSYRHELRFPIMEGLTPCSDQA